MSYPARIPVIASAVLPFVGTALAFAALLAVQAIV